MLPFDLHVLGMPPAFNLSQDQTLQLKSTRLATLSFELNAQPQAFIADSWFCYLTLNKFDSSSRPCRRPHKLPAHTVKDLYRFPFATFRRLSVSPQGAAHHTAVSVSVNTATSTSFRHPHHACASLKAPLVVGSRTS